MLLLVAVIACVVTFVAGVNIVRNIKNKQYAKVLVIALGLAILFIGGYYLLLLFIPGM